MSIIPQKSCLKIKYHSKRIKRRRKGKRRTKTVKKRKKLVVVVVVLTSPDLETHRNATGIKRQCGTGIKINKQLTRIEVSNQNGVTHN